ncbi:MAG: hypothetical protein IKZ69_06300 [Lachnospiraceae bacterium]|nr:hypothetical protein [Lachnospiraceae bacterium]
MMLIFELRAKITALYQKYAFWFNLAARFILSYIAFSRIKSVLNYNPSLGKSVVILALSAICAVLPSTLMVFISAVYATLQIYAASDNSLILAITVFALFMVCYCFFVRFAPKFGAAVVATPVLQTYGFPYAMPLFLGVFGNPVSIVPVCCGVFAYNTIHYVKLNIAAVSKLSTLKDINIDPQSQYMEVLKQIVANPPMYVTMLIMALVIVVVYFVRRIRMDYAFEISIAIGTGVMMLGYIIADLKYDMEIRIGSMVLACLICAGVILFMLFFYRTLQYSAAEQVEFEDDDYYYYVKAIPKIKVGAPKRKEKRVIRRRRPGEDDDDEEFEDAALGLIDYSGKDSGGSPVLRKKTPDEEPEDEDDEFGDELTAEDFKTPQRYGTRVGEKSSAASAAKPVVKPADDLDDDDFDDLDDDLDDLDDEADSDEIAGSSVAGKSYTAGKVVDDDDDFDDDDDDDDEDERVIRGYFPEKKPAGQTDKPAEKASTAASDDDDEDEDYL